MYSFDPDSSLGFVRNIEGEDVAMIIATRLNEFAGSQQAAQDLADYLRKMGRLVFGYNSSPTQPVDLPNGGGKQTRCYRVKCKA